MHPRAERTAFTRVELLVLILILVVFLGVIVPALQESRGPESRAHLINNLRQCAIAAHGCHDIFKRFPPYEGTWQSRTGTLHFHLLPFIEGNDLYQLVLPNGSSHEIRAKIFPPYLASPDPTNSDGKTAAGSGAANFIANHLAFPVSGGRMPDTYRNGNSNCVFFITARANCAGGLSNAWAELGNNAPVTTGAGAGAGSNPPLPFDAAQFTKGVGHALTPHGALVAMGDASTRSLSPTLSRATWSTVTDPASKALPGADWTE